MAFALGFALQICLLCTYTMLVSCLDVSAVNEKVTTHYTPGKKFRDCQEVREAGFMKSGVYTLHMNESFPVQALCDHGLNKSYTIIHQRIYGDVNFYRGYQDYQKGFGNPTSGDFWIGLDMMHHLTSSKQGNIVLDVQLQDWAGNNRAANYKYFYVDDYTTRYTMQIAGFSSLNVQDDLLYSNGMQFATYDFPDIHKCAVNQKGGWWYNYCTYALPTGLYYAGGHYTPAGGFFDGIYWKDWLGYGYSLRFIRLMVSRVQ